MVELRILDRIAAVAAPDWDRYFAHEIERHACLAAIEAAGIDGFAWRYLIVEHDGAPIAAAPAFVTDYRIETTLTGGGRRIAAALRPLLPALLSPRLVCLGSPCTEFATIGFAPDLSPALHDVATAALIDGLETLAIAERGALIAYKDLREADLARFGEPLAARGYERVAGLPVAWLPIDFADLDAYLAGLSPGTRRNMRRKLKTASAVRVERTRDAAPVIDRIMALYHQTRDRAEMKFEALTPAYFTGMLDRLGATAMLTLYWHDGALIAVNLLIEEHGTLLDKFFCMDAAAGRPLNLYFLSWFENLRYCLDRGLSRYQAGQAAYENKVRLGCRIAPTTMLFRHRNRLLNRVLAFAAPRLSAGMPQDREAA